MIPFSILSDLFRKGSLPPEGESAESPALRNALDAESRRLRAAEPDTARQWQYLNLALQRRTAAEKARPKASTPWLLRPAVSFSVVAAVALLAASLMWFDRSSILTYETGKGQQSSILLSDSSEVTLNHTSSLIVETRPFGGTRHVSLKGQAFFHVRKNGSPFIVTTDVGTVQVLGTRFDVRVRGDQMVVGVIDGSVKVAAQRNGHDSSVVLTAGRIVTLAKESFPGMPAEIPFAEYPGWTEGKFLLYRTTLLAACREIESQFDVQIRIEKPHAGEETITGVVDGSNAGAAVAALANLTATKFRHENGVYTLY